MTLHDELARVYRRVIEKHGQPPARLIVRHDLPGADALPERFRGVPVRLTGAPLMHPVQSDKRA